MVSNKNKKSRARRPYELKARARRQDEVHRRITLAAVHLHETVGPARTTMNAIAERAGVRRATVYNHFPTELELMYACSSHWFEKNPPPDQAAWMKIRSPVRRAERALVEMYEYYERGQKMLGKVLRDAAVVPAMDEIRRTKWLPLLESMVEVLAAGWGGSKELRASLRVAVDFFTWELLAGSGLSTAEAAEVAVAWVKAGSKVTV